MNTQQTFQLADATKIVVRRTKDIRAGERLRAMRWWHAAVEYAQVKAKYLAMMKRG